MNGRSQVLLNLKIFCYYLTIDIKTFAISDNKGNPIDSPTDINKPQIAGRKSFNDMVH